MKICVISFDFWHYDAFIVQALKAKKIDAYHIKIGSVTHANLGARITNAFSKVFLGKNLKNEKRQNFVINELKRLGPQDQILVLNPDVFTHQTLEIIKSYTSHLITFLYDNLDRYPVEDKLHFFDKIYSFEEKDCRLHGFEPLTNYNYLNLVKVPKNNSIIYDAFYISSFDKKRIQQSWKLAKQLNALNKEFKFIFSGKKAWKENIKQNAKNKERIIFTPKKMALAEVLKEYNQAKILVDFTRENQHGLSFRVFEAMALNKKLITDNPLIKNYDFYNPNNILIVDENLNNLTEEFFKLPYQELSEEIYNYYTVESWIKRVFEI